jgi:hypothetical protein
MANLMMVLSGDNREAWGTKGESMECQGFH